MTRPTFQSFYWSILPYVAALIRQDDATASDLQVDAMRFTVAIFEELRDRVVEPDLGLSVERVALKFGFAGWVNGNWTCQAAEL